MNIYLKAALGVVCLLGASSAARAQATDTIAVSLEVTAECTIDVPPLAFPSTGIVDADVAVQADMTIQCTPGSPYRIALNNGLGTGTSAGSHVMMSGSNTLNYMVYRDEDHLQPWGAVGGTTTVDGTANGSEQDVTIYGLVPAGQNVAVGNYADTLTATITYGAGL
jgi:spore coat protein U-like protein